VCFRGHEAIHGLVFYPGKAAKSSALPPRSREKTETTILPHHSFPPSIHNAQEHSLDAWESPPAFLTAFSESSTQIVPQNKKGPENVPDLFT
jgi:hypothetical protein